jgi:spermidine synthase
VVAPIVEVPASEQTSLGMVYLRQRELRSQPGTVVLELRVDHVLLMSSVSTHSERALARRAIELHGGGALDVLVGGLGLGYTAREALRSSAVASVEVIELLPELIGWFGSGLLPLAGELAGDPRFSLRRGDVYAHLGGPAARRYDLILIDVDHAPEERLGDTHDVFYSDGALRKSREHLAPNGLLGVWSYAESPAFAKLLGRVFAEVRVERVTFWNPVSEEEESNWLFLARR